METKESESINKDLHNENLSRPGIKQKIALSSIAALAMKRQRAADDKELSLFKSGLVRLVFLILFGCLSYIVSRILYGGAEQWLLVLSAVIIGAGFYTVSFFFTYKQFFRIFLWILGPVFSLLVTEVLIGNININPFINKLSFTQALLNFVWYYMLAALLYLATGRMNLSSGIAVCVGFIWGNINYYIYQFRGRILFPADLTALKTAVSVQSDYNWTPNIKQWFFLGIFIVYLLLLIISSGRKGSKRPRLRFTIPIVAVCAIYIFVFFGTPFIRDVGIQPSFWYTQQNGVTLNFMVNLDYSYVDEPSGYSTEVLTRMCEGPAPVIEDVQRKPNIIVIMNEAFSDIGVLGEFETNEDWMPFLRGLKENTIKGYAYSSVYGGNTANSEYEFLTGNTMAFLPAGTVAYQLYASEDDYCLTGELGELGYKSIAMHPYDKKCWNRVAVYEDYGFDETYFKDKYDKAGYVRRYIGDEVNYEKLISIYEENRSKAPDTPLFFFNVTMQNHGGYNQEWINLERTVYLTGENEGKYATVDQYLSLIRKSDEALEKLVNYFSQVEEPTIVLFFGDHQPALESEFYLSLFGKPNEELTTAEREKLHMVPFMLWANYDIDEKEGISTSFNYLSALLLDTAGLPKTEYQEFLSELSGKLPVINSVGYLEAGGEFTDEVSTMSKEVQDLIGEYKIAQYNGVFDKDSMVEPFFFLPE